MKRYTMILLVVLVILSSLLSACKKDNDYNPCNNGDACGLTAPAGDLQSTIETWVKDTCPDKNNDGYCDTMGQK